ncbi:hypothetical protein PBY51_020421 [Eleginops maclovinus]|uniref:Uncharacterized protein n=1 Tax=Eleginops maclovinus TaxID=56733 RepID=A0AAN7XSQ3_ELEMC|nr:hypothetical protein PBY51_020421 [Eleginops maclovinus]
MTQFGGRGGRGAEQQCRKRGGSSKDGGVTPLKQTFEGLKKTLMTFAARNNLYPRSWDCMQFKHLSMWPMGATVLLLQRISSPMEF